MTEHPHFRHDPVIYFIITLRACHPHLYTQPGKADQHIMHDVVHISNPGYLLALHVLEDVNLFSKVPSGFIGAIGGDAFVQEGLFRGRGKEFVHGEEVC